MILIGIETHVCVLQTAFGLKEQGKEMVLFEWAHQAGTEMFKYLSREFLR